MTSQEVFMSTEHLRLSDSFSVKYEKAVDIKKALQYPLFPVTLSIANADGSKRGTKKSDLLPIIKHEVINENDDDDELFLWYG